MTTLNTLPTQAAATAAPTGFIGIGNMGLAMALRLRDAGWPVWVHDIDPARVAQAQAAGCQAADTPAQLAAALADAMGAAPADPHPTDGARLIIAVVDAAQTEAVLFGPQGAAAALPAGSTVLLCPTIAPQSVEALAARLHGLGTACIDAPMSGGPQRARDGSMSLMVACADAHWLAQQPLLQRLASRLFRVGSRVGDGARTKLVNNLVAAINLAGAAEALALAERLGLDPALTLSVINQSSGHSWVGADRMPRALTGDFRPLAHTTLLAKDSALALAMARQAGLPAPPLGSTAAALFQQALAAGYGGEDDARLFSLMQALMAPAQGHQPRD